MLKRNTALLVAVCLVTMTAPATALAGGGIGLNSFQVGMGGTVQGACNSIMGNIVNVQNLQNVQSALVKVIENVGKAVSTGQNQQLVASLKERNQQLQDSAMNLKKLDAAQALRHYHNQIGGINASGGACAQISGAADTMNGITSAKSSAAQITGSALGAEQPAVNPLDAVNEISTATAPEISAASLIPMGSASSQGMTAPVISAYIKNAVAPINPQEITAAAKSTAAGQQYQAVKHVTDARESLATVTLGAIAKYNLPTTPATFANQLWQRAGEPGNAPGVANGNISDNGLLRVITDSRYASGDYVQKIMTHGNVWQLRQYAMELAAQLRMEMQEQDMLEHTLALQSAMLAAQLQPDIAHMNSLRGNAMEQAANSPSAAATGAP